MEVVTRTGTEADLEELVALYRRFCEDVAGERGGHIYVRKEGFPVPVGIAVGHLDELADSSVLASVDVLYVDTPAREVGVGEILLEAVATWAVDNGAIGLDVRVLPGMRQAKNFLEGTGFAARLLVMHRRLG
jgi:GNAT superfamily N-acetyltransferase